VDESISNGAASIASKAQAV